MDTTAAVAPPPLRILVIDDDEQTLKMLARLLAMHGFDPLEASNGQAGIDLAQREQPDLIICDITMPQVDGYDVLRALKRDLRTAVIPFIFLSGDQDEDSIRLGMGLGADDYLTKPFDGRQLLDSIMARIERQRAVNHKLEELRLSLAQSVPNEFFTPLNAILGFSMLVLDSLRAGDEINREDLEDSVHSIHEAGEQLLRIASNYVLFTQLTADESAQVTPSAAPDLAFGQWEPGVARTVRKLALQRNRMKDIHYSFSPATLAVRKEHLEKIVFELLDNALKFSRAGQWVSVTGIAREDRYVFRIIDHGCGMTDEQIGAVAPMMQFDRQRHVQRGVGLGLPVSQLIARRYSGTISMVRNRDEGLTVEASLPLAGG
jgi:two-component system, sensor histidine kinase and response regulator